MDGWTEVYVWLGWRPEEKLKLLREANDITGSSHFHWARDKKLAMLTTKDYVKACNRTRTPRTYVVNAGMEHECFINLFPYWEAKKEVQDLICKEKVCHKRHDLESELEKYSRTEFTLEELKEKPPPEVVDPAKLEFYLTDEVFKSVFKMDKLEFNKLPLWKQSNQKRGVGLF